MTIFNSILFTFSTIAIYVSFLLFRKSDKYLHFTTWAIISIPLLMCYFSLINALLKVFAIPFNNLYFSIINLLVSLFFLYQIIKKKKRQTYIYNMSDYLIVALLALITLVVFILQFSNNLEIAYQTSDPSVHYGLAMDAIRNGETTGMFFSEVNNALMISTFLPFLNSEFFAYKLFIINDGMMLFLSGATFLVLMGIFEIRSKIQKSILFILGILYVFAYPLTNMIFGFNYLGLSVIVLSLIIFILKSLEDKDISFNLAWVILSISCLALAVCYMLFAPAVWIIVFCNIGVYFYEKNKKILSKEFIFASLKIFIVPTVLTLKFCYFDYFESRNVSLVDSIGFEGGIYKNLYTNLIIFIPLFIYGFIKFFKSKKFNVYNLSFSIFSIFCVLLFIFMYKGFVSEYYFFKVYFPLWLLFMLIVGNGIKSSLDKDITLFISLGCLIPISIGLSFLGPERYEIKNDVNKLTDIYVFNKDKLTNRRVYWPDLLKLYKFAIDTLDNGEHKSIPFFVGADNCEHWYWYEALSGEDSSEYYTWDIGKDAFIKKLEANEFDYIIVLNGDLLYLDNLEYFSKFEVVYHNKDGQILKVN